MQGLIRSRFFWKLFATYFAALGLTAVVAAFLADRWLSRSLTEQFANTLQDHCVLLAPFAERALQRDVPPEEVQAEIERIGASSELRVTLVFPDGTVLADTSQDPKAMENHGQRPEILAAGQQAFGLSKRFSRTVGIEMLYVAKVLRQDGRELGVVRVAFPIETLQSYIASARASVFLGTGVGLLLALLLSVYLANRTTTPIIENTILTSRPETTRRNNVHPVVRSRALTAMPNPVE